MDSTVLAAPATNEEMKMMQNNTFNTQPGQLRVAVTAKWFLTTLVSSP
ncbi:MAG: hypothetical protein K0R48_1290 [Gammaproteobacteria bacterium]|nr:hypothetical protein [Gammaproteobacteria bacterium]